MGSYESFYTVHKDQDSLSIPGFKTSVVSTDGEMFKEDEAQKIEDWCNQQWVSKNFQYLLIVIKWCTRRVSITSKISSSEKNGSDVIKIKEQPSDFTKQNHLNLLKERGLSKIEKAWIKDVNKATVSSGVDKSLARMAEWCNAVASYIYTDEKDTDEYKRVVKYCIKKEYWKDLDSAS